MRKFFLSIFFLSILPAVSGFAGARHFTFVYDTTTSAPGSVELENWVTWRRTTDPGRFDHLREVVARETERVGRDLSRFRLYAFASGGLTKAAAIAVHCSTVISPSCTHTRYFTRSGFSGVSVYSK